MASQIVQITGFVQKVTGKIYHIYDVNEKKVIKVTFDGFLPLLETDVIFGSVVMGQRNQNKFLNKPMVRFSTEKESIVTCIKKSQKFAITPQLANKVYDKILTDLQGIMSVSDYLDKVSLEFSKDNSLEMEGLLDYLTKIQFKKLLLWWYKNRILRKLYLFGMNNKEIRTIESFCMINPLQIYEQCLIDPFILVPLPLEKCYEIYQINLKQFTEDQVYRANIVRTIYNNMENKSWTGTPSKFITSQYKDIAKHIQIMRDEYHVSGEFFTLYLELAYKAETLVAKALSEMVTDNKKSVENESEPEYEPEYENPLLTDNQKLAIKSPFNQRITVVTGPAGSGKTTIIKELVHNLEKKDIPYMIGSFTGKAVARIKEVIQRNSPMTLHMMIAKHKQLNPFKVLIIDETSMITIELLYLFIEKFGYNYKLVLIGDPNQLEPISWGNLFSQILKSGIIRPIHLEMSHRSDIISYDNYIKLNAEKLIDYIKSKEEASEEEFITPYEFQIGNNFTVIPGNLDIVYAIVTALSSNGIKSTELSILSPYVKNLSEINKTCQSIFNINKRYVTDSKGIMWIIGDKVSITTNNYNLNLMNGDEGIITDVTDEIGESGFYELLIEFKSGNTFKFSVTYDKDFSVNDEGSYDEQYVSSAYPTLSNLTHSYGQTVHKSQGSEYEYVILYLDSEQKGSSSFINRHLIYTAITRPRKAIWIIGDIQQLELHATMNSYVRYDNLAQRLRNNIKMISEST